MKNQPGAESPIVNPTDGRVTPITPGAGPDGMDTPSALVAMVEEDPECVAVVRAIRDSGGRHRGDALVFANAAFRRAWLGDDGCAPQLGADLFATVPALAALRGTAHNVVATREVRTSEVVVTDPGAPVQHVGASMQPWGDGVLIALGNAHALSATLPREALGALGDSVIVLQAIRDDGGDIVDEEIVYANAAWRRAFLPSGTDEPTGRRFLETAPSLASHLEMHKRVIATGVGEQSVLEMADRPGWFDVAVVRLGDGVVVLVRDVTETYLARAALAARESELAEAQRIAHVGSWTSQRDTGEVVWSEETYRILGVPVRPGTLARADQPSLLDERAFALRSAALSRLLETGEPFELETPITQPGGAVRHLVVRGEAVRDAAGVITGAHGTVTDVTASREAAEALRETSAHFQMLAEHASDIVFRCTPQGLFEWVSPSVTAVLGWTPEDLLGDTVFAYVHPDDTSLVSAQAGRAGATGGASCETRYRRRDGSYRWFSIVTRPITDEKGVVVALVGSARDVDTEHQALLALRDSKARYEELVASIPLGVYVYRNNAAGEMVYDYLSPQAGRLLGIDPRAPLADLQAGFADVHPDDVAGLMALSGSTRADDVPFRWEGRFMVHGEARRIRIDAEPTPLPDGWTRWHGIVEDVTAHRVADDNVRRLVTAVEQSDDTIIISNLDGSIAYANPAFERISGYAVADVIGKNPRLLKSGIQDGAFYKDLWATLGTGKTWRGELHNRRNDASIYIEATTITPVRGPNGDVINYVAVQRDVTGQRELEARLRQSQRLEAVGQLAGGIAHDFNNLLAVIRGYSEIVAAALPPDSATREDAEQVLVAADRGAALIRQLLAFSRRQTLEPVVLDLTTVIDDLLPMLRRLTGTHVDIQTAHAPDLGRVLADPGGMEQVIVNLAVNARDAMPDGGLLFIETSNIEVNRVEDEAGAGRGDAAQTPQPFVRITVRDTGTGMNETTLNRIFEPFFTTKELGKGTGLGLATVHGIVTQSGGVVGVESTLGHGAAFMIDLPRADAPVEGRTSKQRLVEQTASVGARGETVLVAEDETAVRLLLARVLRGLGYVTLVAASGDEALELAAGHDGPLHALVSDVQMPGIQGPELARRLRAERPELAVVLVSGFIGDHLIGEAGGLAGVGVLEKPFDAATLGAAVRAALDDSRQRAAKR